MAVDAETRTLVLTAAGTVVGLLVAGSYEALANLTGGGPLPTHELRRQVAALGRPLVQVPPEVWAAVEVVPATGADPPAYDVAAPLWTAAGPAGQVLRIRAVANPWGLFDPQILGLEEAAGPPAVGVAPIRPPDQPRPSDAPVPERWRPELAEVVRRLAAGDYEGLVRDGLADPPAGAEDGGLGYWIERHPARLVELPDEAWAYSEHFPIGPGEWGVVVDLWTAEEGRSDLSLEATVRDDGERIQVRVTGVRVL